MWIGAGRIDGLVPVWVVIGRRFSVRWSAMGDGTPMWQLPLNSVPKRWRLVRRHPGWWLTLNWLAVCGKDSNRCRRHRCVES